MLDLSPKWPYIDREYTFLKAVYIESYNEGVKGQQAVAQVLYNRYVSRVPRRYVLYY